MLYGDLFVANASMTDVASACIHQRCYIGRALLVRKNARSARWHRVQWLFYEYRDDKQREQYDDALHGTGGKCT
jgi:hypothetical protein